MQGLTGAQGPAGVVATNGTAAYDFTNTNGFVAPGTFGTGALGATGLGTRMVWYPRKAAFRVGFVNFTQWDDAGVRPSSAAMGFSTTASGGVSAAIRQNTIASGQDSTAIGNQATASGVVSTAMGYQTTASGVHGTAMGNLTKPAAMSARRWDQTPAAAPPARR